MAVELMTLVTKTRGRSPREVEYQGLGRTVKTVVEKDGKREEEESITSDGVVTTLDEFLHLPNIDGQLQKVLDFAAIGYNKFRREQAVDVDEFAAYIDKDWDDKKTDAFKRSVKALAKVAEMDIDDAAKLVLSKMKKMEQPVPVSA